MITSHIIRKYVHANAMAVGLAVTALSAGSVVAQAQAIEGQIEYGFWGNAKRAEVTGAVARLFEQAFPGTKIQETVAEFYAYTERLTVLAAARDLPCVTQTQSTFLASFAQRGALQALDDLIASNAIDTSGIPNEVLDNGRIDGKLYMIPTGVFTRLPAYNVAMAEKYGIGAPPQRGTFEEYKQWLIGAQAKLPAGVFATENQGADMFMLYSWVAGHGAKFFENGRLALEPELLQRYFEFWEDLRTASVATPADQLDEHFATPDATPMARGKALSTPRDLPQLSQVRKALESAGLPADIQFFDNPVEPNAKSGNVPGSNGLSVAANCENIPTAAAFINFFSNDPKAAATFQSNNGIVISEAGRKAVLEDENTPEQVKEAINKLSEILSRGDVAVASYPSGYQALAGILRRNYEAVALNGVKPADAAAQFFTEAARALR